MVKRRNQKGGFFGLFGPSKSDEHKACVKKCDDEEKRREQAQATQQSNSNSESASQNMRLPAADVQAPVMSEASAASGIANVGGYKKGSRSKTRKGRKDFVTHKGSKYYNRKGHRQTRNAKGKKGKPYKGGSGCHLTHKKKKRKHVKKARKSATKKHNKKHKKRGGTRRRRRGGCDTCGCKN